MTLRLLRLTLTDFRNYRHLTWAPDARVNVLFGPNGSGKTNLLEAISLLSPGRGLRGARNADFARRDDAATGRWGVAARLETAAGVAEIGTGTPPEGPADRRVFRLDGAAPRSQAEIAGAGGDGVADAADGPAVAGWRFRPAPVPRSAGLGAGAGTCAAGRFARGGDGRPQSAAARKAGVTAAWLAALEDAHGAARGGRDGGPHGVGRSA